MRWNVSVISAETFHNYFLGSRSRDAVFFRLAKESRLNCKFVMCKDSDGDGDDFQKWDVSSK